MKTFQFILLMFAICVLANCSSSVKTETDLVNKFQKLSLIESAKYYSEIRTELNFADDVFSKIIVPQLDSCKLIDLQEIRQIVNKTPIYETVDEIFENRLNATISNAEDKLWQYSDSQMNVLLNNIIPEIFKEFRTKKNVNIVMDKVIKDYKGFFGKIFDSEDDFQEEWEKQVTLAVCRGWIDSLKCITNFKQSVSKAYKDYYEYNCPKAISIFNVPDIIAIDTTMPRDIVTTWISGEKDKTFEKVKGIALDFAESAIEELVSGRGRGGKMKGSKGKLQSSNGKTSNNKSNKKNTGVDYGEIISETYDVVDEELQNMSDDQKLSMALSEYMIDNIAFGIVVEYLQYFVKQNNSILSQLIKDYKPNAKATEYANFLSEIIASKYNTTNQPHDIQTNKSVSTANKVINNPKVKNAPNKMRVTIRRVTITDNNTIIECIIDNTKSSYSYIAIDAKTYIIANGKENQITHTDGIGISPDKTAIAKGRVSSFSLYFPSIPQNTETIDLIESGKNGWKFYGIQLK